MITSNNINICYINEKKLLTLKERETEREQMIAATELLNYLKILKI